MPRRLTRLHSAALAALLNVLAVAAAADTVESVAAEETAVERIVATVLDAAEVRSTDIAVALDGEPLELQVREGADGAHYIQAAPVFDALGSAHAFRDGVLHITRAPDRAKLTFSSATGLVTANGEALGHLKTFGVVEGEDVWLTPNAVAVLTGTHARYGEVERLYDFELDPRLRTVTGFDIFVNDVPLFDLPTPPRAVGPVLLLPLGPIAEALGHRVDREGGRVRVRRAQDSAVFTLDLASGLISLAGEPIGISKDAAFVDPATLLLPSTTLETLTGTHIATSGQRVNIDIDDRLRDIVAPGERIADIAAATPFTPESLTFALGPRQLNTVAGDFRYRGYNARLRYELQSMPDRLAELEPSWLSLDYEHVSGVRGAVGDIYTRNRETSDVGADRLRGFRATQANDKGRMSLAVGAPLRGSRRVGDDQFRDSFGGLAAGMRWQDARGWEAGAALAYDGATDDARAVLSAISRRLGTDGPSRATYQGAASLGVFAGPNRSRTLDLRFDVGSQYDFDEDLTLSTTLEYVGVEFQRALLDREARERLRDVSGDALDDTLDDAIEPGLDALERTLRGEDTLRYGATLGWRPGEAGAFRNVALNLNLDQRRSALTTSSTTTTASRAGVDLAALTPGPEIGVNLGMSLFDIDSETPERADRGREVRASAFKRVRSVDLRADYSNLRTDRAGRRETANLTASPGATTLALPRGAALSLVPTVGTAMRDGSWRLQGSAVAQLDTGELFGPRNRVGATFGVVQSVRTRGGGTTRAFLSVDAARRIPIGENMALGIGFATDLDDNHTLGLTLRGRYDFNPRRRLTETREGAGILSGQVFFDRNRDSIRQPDEPGLPGVGLRLENTPFALRVDPNGAFTIRNLPEGVYKVAIVGKTLPLGYSMSADAAERVSISEGRLTRHDVPVVQRGQLRGFLFADGNGNGAHDAGETRLENTRLELRGPDGESHRLRTTTFGQFAFDDLSAADYTLYHDGREVSRVALADHERLMARLAVAIPSEPSDTAVAEDIQHTGEAGLPEPAP